MAISKSMLLFVAAAIALLCGVDSFQPSPRHPSTRQFISQTKISAAPLEEDGDAAVGMDRRQALISTGMAALSLSLGMKALPAFANDNLPKKTILVTGCNSGIGFQASRFLARQGHTIIMACRTLEKATGAADKIQEETSDAKLIPLECDLASQESIRSFVKNINDKTVDVACYNAGLALNTEGQVERTKEGFELTVGTNHLGHFYLHNLLFPKLNKDNGKIVITASSVHDPDSPGGAQGKAATLGNLEGLIRDGKNFEMVDGNPYNGDKAYKDSKLCNIFFLRELQRRLASSESTKGMSVNAFSPGLITSSGFFRYQNPVFSKVFDVAASKLFKVAETPEWGGAALAYMTTVDTKGEYYNSAPGSSKYGDAAFGKEFTIAQVSKEAQDDAKGRKLWELSEKLVGV